MKNQYFSMQNLVSVDFSLSSSCTIKWKVAFETTDEISRYMLLSSSLLTNRIQKTSVGISPKSRSSWEIKLISVDLTSGKF